MLAVSTNTKIGFVMMARSFAHLIREVMFYSEFYEPVVLSEGDSVYYDANMGHMLTSVSEEDAQILWVTAK